MKIQHQMLLGVSLIAAIFVAVVATVMLTLACLGLLNAPLDSVPTIRWRRDREQ